MKDPRGTTIIPGALVVYNPSNCVPLFAKVLELRPTNVRLVVAYSVPGENPPIYRVTIKTYAAWRGFGTEPCLAQCLVIKPEGIPDNVMDILDKEH